MEQVIDPSFDPAFKGEIRRVLEIGLLCTQTAPASRPAMRKVAKLLAEAAGRGGGNRSRNPKKEGKLTPYMYEDGADDAGLGQSVHVAEAENWS
ncbi:hypothetical protein MLD38_033329 [Melastoma candidum]|nr:hypothetical protein MLD38_033329 [Melastoma candidum]